MKKLIPLLTFFIVISCDFSNSLTNEQLYSIEKDAEEISKILIIIDEGSDKFMDKVYEGFNQDDFETKNLNKTIEKVKLILIDLFKDITRSKGLLVKYQNLSKRPLGAHALLHFRALLGFNSIFFGESTGF